MIEFLFGRLVPLRGSRIVKLLPDSPPHRGETILVDGERVRVTRCRVTWDGPRWTIQSLRVRRAG